MNMNYGLFIFTRDFRIIDNTALIKLSKKVDYIIPIFIFTKLQITKLNIYRSIPAISFIKDCLIDLNNQIIKINKNFKLYTFYGVNHCNIINKIIKEIKISRVYINEDYTPFAIKRELDIENLCNKNNIIFKKFRDHLLINSLQAQKKDGSYYYKFTPFFNSVKKYYDKPNKTTVKNFTNVNFKTKTININILLNKIPKCIINGSRLEAIKLIKKRESSYKNYNNTRNLLNYTTSGLSPYIKFGCISIREVMHYFRKKLSITNDLIKQLYWREFYYYIAINNPNVLDINGKKNFNKKYDKIKWNTQDNSLFDKWKNGNTGIPIIDASMRELNNTGLMHNRSRLLVASFLTKNMFWDWKEGEKYFATKLIDYDPIVNNGNWQWVSGSGVDSQPYFRIFNPYIQSNKFDHNTEYIKKWVPELKDIEPKHIHNWNIYYKIYKNIYLKPMLDISETSKKTIEVLKKNFNN